MVENVQYAPFVQAFGVFLNVFAIVQHQLPLGLKRPFECIPVDIRAHDIGHAAKSAIVQKDIHKRFMLHLRKWPRLDKVRKHLADDRIVIPLRPQELLEIEGAHFEIGFVTYAIALDSLVVNPEHRTTAYHVEAAVLFEEFQRRRNFGEFLQFVKKQKRFSLNEPFRRIQKADVAHNARR